jgi:uncharacterized membrane protein
MSYHQDRIDLLNQKLEALLGKQEGFAKELMALYREIEDLKKMGNERPAIEKVIPAQIEKEQHQPISVPKEDVIKENAKEPIAAPQPQKDVPIKVRPKSKTKSNWEKFIGENLINKIGIIITVLGVAIGAKYSIENNLISPLTRIILGYLVGLGLLGFGIKLKAKYENYSAVLVSGALAILYFITFAAFSFYDLFPQPMAFVLMLIFTAFGVVAALNYNKQVIAHIGLVGAYAVPFLLSNDSGDPQILFGYMGIINIGVLVIAYKKYWKPLYYSSFIITWMIYGSWIGFSFNYEEHYATALIFVSLFFLIFYATFLSYKLKASEKFKKSDIVLLLFNSFLFYGFGYGLLSQNDTGGQLLGVFTLGNAILHFIVSLIIYKKKLADRNLYYLVSGLVLIFLTIAIPVQLDGNWVTLLWAFEAALLFWIGRIKNVFFYEYLSYPLMILALFSLLQDWTLSYTYNQFSETPMKPILNVTFMSSILFLVSFGFINWINNITHQAEITSAKTTIGKIMSFAIPGILLIVLYMSFFLEIQLYWDALYYGSEVAIADENQYDFFKYNLDIRSMGNIWLINYSLLFMSVLILVNHGKIKNRVLGILSLTISFVLLLIFLTFGLYELSELRESYVDQTLAEYYETGYFNLIIRYVSFTFLGLLLFGLYRLIRQQFMKINFSKPFEILLHVSILWVASSELLHWMDISGANQSYKLGLSILWGIYSLLLIILGIWKNKKYIRLAAIILFGITLIKLFFYDIASLNTISKTIVFVSLGILLLIISFLYNKYKLRISDEDTN